MFGLEFGMALKFWFVKSLEGLGLIDWEYGGIGMVKRKSYIG